MSASAPGSLIERRNARMRSSALRRSRISSTTARYSRSWARIPSLRSVGSSCAGDLDAERAVDAGLGRAGDAAANALDGHGLGATGQLQAVVDLGDGADGGERIVLAGNEEDLVLVADVDRQRQVHPGEDDDVVEGNKGKCAHGSGLSDSD